jgi:hypothetical protein
MAYAIWNLMDRCDMQVVGRDSWHLRAHPLGCEPGTVCEIADYRVAAANPNERKALAASMQFGQPVTARVQLWWDDKRGYWLTGDEIEAQLVDLKALLVERPVIVMAEVFEKMHGALGFYLVTGPFAGLRGVVHRINMPGRNTNEQHAHANYAQVGDRRLVQVLSVNTDVFAQWNVKLSLRHEQTRESGFCARSRPGCVTAGGDLPFVFQRRTFEAVVGERLDAETMRVYLPTGYTKMPAILRVQDALGTTRSCRRHRFDQLRSGDKVSVSVELRQGKTLELVASERQAWGEHLAATMPTVQSVVTRKWRQAVQVRITSSPAAGLSGIIADAPQARVGDTISAIVIGCRDRGTCPVRLNCA